MTSKCPGSLSETFSVERGVPACDHCGKLFARGCMVIPPHYLPDFEQALGVFALPADYPPPEKRRETWEE